ncbi:MAG TPA: pilus assembly protein PilP [Candidatus Binatia bacterium]|nr:pilus assembly protein PilP [Candidatus Binatia bacterium]
MRWWVATGVVMLWWVSTPGFAQAPPPPEAPPSVLAGEPAPRAATTAPSYDPTGKRDPFRPFTLDLRSAAPPPREPQTPLQRYDIGQLTVVGILWEISPARAMIEDGIGMGYIVMVGTPIGRNNGVVKSIEPSRVIVEEKQIDFYGEERTSEVVMEIPTEAGSKQPERERQ